MGTKAPKSDSVTVEMTVAALQKGSPYPSDSEKNAPDHSAPGHHLPEKVNSIYNAIMREHPEYGKEKAMKIAWERSGEKHERAARLSKWQVVGLGELQQPGGVGATQEYNPVVDGVNPEGPTVDNASNSPEQEVAIETLVNMAVDMLNRGQSDEEIIAQLAHDGCGKIAPPEEILERAKAQPEQSPISDEIGQDPFDAPPASDGQTGQMESLSQQPPVLAASEEEREKCELCQGGPKGNLCEKCKGRIQDDVRKNSGKRVKIANSSLTGVELERWEDMWGQGTVKIALDDGGTVNVSPEVVQEFEGEAPRDPVTDIQSFIDNLPKVEPTRPHIEARIENLRLVRQAVRNTISKVGFSDQVKLDVIDANAQDEILALKESLGAIITESDVAYLSGQQTYRPHGLDIPGVEKNTILDPAFQSKIAEKAAIFVAELPSEMLSDPDGVAYAAARYAHAYNGNVPEFTRLAEEQRVMREEYEAEGEQDQSIDNEGPAEALFLG